MIKIRSMSSNLGAALCEVEFQDIDENHPLKKVRDTYTVTVEGRFTDSTDPLLIAELEKLLAENA